MSTEPAPMPGDPTAYSKPPAARGGPLSGSGGVVVIVIALGLAGYLGYRLFTKAGPDAPRAAERNFLCIEKNKHFRYALKSGEDIPVESPFSHKKTGYPAEPCHCIVDGKPSAEPTWVVLNETMGKTGDTYCPNCSARVQGHNEELRPRVEEPAGSPAATQPARSDR